MARRKLPYFQILDVLSKLPLGGGAEGETEGCDYSRLRQVVLPERLHDSEHAPPGCFVTLPESILLPKKKRGEKFVVRYTTAHEKEF